VVICAAEDAGVDDILADCAKFVDVEAAGYGFGLVG